MVFPSSSPGHSRRSVVNVDKFSSTNLSGPHPGKFGIYPSAVGGPLSTISLPPRYLPFHDAALSTLPRMNLSFSEEEDGLAPGTTSLLTFSLAFFVVSERVRCEEIYERDSIMVPPSREVADFFQDLCSEPVF